MRVFGKRDERKEGKKQKEEGQGTKGIELNVRSGRVTEGNEGRLVDFYLVPATKAILRWNGVEGKKKKIRERESGRDR